MAEHNHASLIELARQKSTAALSKKEQGRMWLIDHGPLVIDPPLAQQTLSAIVDDGNAMRLRRSVYLLPNSRGRFPTLPEAVNLVDPGGYISGLGALWLQGIGPEVRDWYSVTPVRQSDISYRSSRVHFVLSPRQSVIASKVSILVIGQTVTAASVVQAIVDEAVLMPFGLDYRLMARLLRIALSEHKASEADMVAALYARGSVAAARRLGFLTEIVTSHVNEEMMAMARGNDGVTRTAGDSIHEPKWRLYLPDTREAMLDASR